MLLRAILILSITSLFASSQSYCQTTDWEHPVIKRLEQKDTSVAGFTRTTSGLVNLAILAKKEGILYYFTKFGQVFDTLILDGASQLNLLRNHSDVFTFYKQRITVYQPLLSAARQWLRQQGITTTSNAGIAKVLSLPAVAKASNALQKMLAIESYERESDRIVAEFDWDENAKTDTLIEKALKEKGKPGSLTLYKTPAGTVTQYLNADSLSFVGSAIIKENGSTVYFYDWHNALTDSITLKQGRMGALVKEKTDVFGLYRGWLEWQLQALKEQELTVQQAVSYHSVKRWSVGGQYAVYRDNTVVAIKNVLDTMRQQEAIVIEKLLVLSQPDARLLHHQIFQKRYRGQKTSRAWLGEYGWATVSSFTRGEKNYELSNHLGNVLVTISDKKIGVPSQSNPSQVEYYTADVISAQDYFPFGMTMPGRQFGELPRYGFNGKEKDNEVKGEGNQYDYGFRIYDPRIGKFLSVDPLAKSFPWNSPYSYAEGDVLRSIDLDGLEKYVVTYWYDSKNNHRKTTIKAIRAQDSKEIMDMNFHTANKDLTDMNVWVRRLYLDGRQKAEGSGKATLNASENALFGKAATRRRKEKNEFADYDFGDERDGEDYKSEPFDRTKFEYREVEQSIPLIHHLNSSFGKEIAHFASPTGEGSLGSQELSVALDAKAKQFWSLPGEIKEDGGVKSINITLNVAVPGTLDDKSFAGMKQAYEQIGQEVRTMYLKSGVKNINVSVNVQKKDDFANYNTTTPFIQIQLKR